MVYRGYGPHGQWGMGQMGNGVHAMGYKGMGLHMGIGHMDNVAHG